MKKILLVAMVALPFHSKAQLSVQLTRLLSRIESQLVAGKKLVQLQNEVRQYTADDWIQVARARRHLGQEKSGYLRIPVGFDTELFEAFFIRWSPYAQSMIHNHAESGCIQKVLSGELQECRYRLAGHKPILIGQTRLEEGATSYIDNQVALHAIQNVLGWRTWSLHIYQPPGFKTYYFKVN